VFSPHRDVRAWRFPAFWTDVRHVLEGTTISEVASS
jgi:hypothetical protein